MRYRKPDELKETEIDWLKKIPIDWDETSLRHVSKSIGNGTTESQIDEGFTEYPVTRIETISSGSIDFGAVGYVNKFKGIDDYKLNNGDIVFSHINSLPMVGNCAMYISDKDLYHGMNLLRIQPNENAVPSFLIYLLKSHFFNEKVRAVAKHAINQVSVSTTNLKALPVLLPPKSEQRSIATFLDRKTEAIDGLIQKKEQLIDRLKEKRQALITRAVTKGLDPDMPMKDSGIEWLGEIPEEWETSKLKFLTNKIIDGTHHTPTYTNEGVPFLRVTDIHERDIDLSEVKRISKDEHVELTRRCNPEKGDLLVSKNGTIGVPRVINWDWEFSIFVSLCLIKTKENILVDYLYYNFLSKTIEEQIRAGGKTNTITNLHLDKIQNFIITLPPLEEQKRVVKYLNSQVKSIKKGVDIVRDQIDRLREYRQSLISAAVTGKIDVRSSYAEASAAKDEKEVELER